MRKDFGRIIKKLRTNAGLSQKEVSAALGHKSSQFISNIERGVAFPPAKNIKTMARLYKTDPKYIAVLLTRLRLKEFERDLRKEYKSILE